MVKRLFYSFVPFCGTNQSSWLISLAQFCAIWDRQIDVASLVSKGTQSSLKCSILTLKRGHGGMALKRLSQVNQWLAVRAEGAPAGLLLPSSSPFSFPHATSGARLGDSEWDTCATCTASRGREAWPRNPTNIKHARTSTPRKWERKRSGFHLWFYVLDKQERDVSLQCLAHSRDSINF